MTARTKKSSFSPEVRAKLYYFLVKVFPKASRQRVGIQRRYVGGEKQALLEKTIREKLGRIDLDGNNVDDKLKTFILSAPDRQLLGLLELMPVIEASMHHSDSRGAELAKKIDSCLAELGIDARFDDEGRLLKPTANYVDLLLSDPFENLLGQSERVRIHYFVEETFPPEQFHGTYGGYTGGEEQAFLEEKLRKRLARLELAPGSSIAEILKSFILDAPPHELLVLLELMPQVLSDHFESANTVPADHRRPLISHLRRQIIELLRAINMEMVFAANGKLESTRVDTASRAINQLPTRDVLHGQLSEMLTQHAVVSVAFMDLDNFKVVNDRLGHTPAGDKCLDDFVALVQVITLNKARFYRYAGDEFVLVFPNFTAAEAAATSERIRKAVVDARLGGDAIDVTTSVGVASSDAFSEAATLVAAADDAMYAAKKVNGPNQVRVAPLTPDIAATAARERAEAKGR